MDNILKSNRSNSETVVVSLSSWGPARYSKLGDVSTGGLTHITSSEDYPFILPGTYGVAKQASIRFAREIVKRFGVRSFSVHPGFVSTKLGTTRGNKVEEYGAALWWYILSKFTKVKSIGEGASTTVLCATDSTVNGSGAFYSDNNLAKYPKDEDNDPTKLHERDAERYELV